MGEESIFKVIGVIVLVIVGGVIGLICASFSDLQFYEVRFFQQWILLVLSAPAITMSWKLLELIKCFTAKLYSYLKKISLNVKIGYIHSLHSM